MQPIENQGYRYDVRVDVSFFMLKVTVIHLLGLKESSRVRVRKDFCFFMVVRIR